MASSSSFRRRDLKTFDSYKSKILLTLIVFGIIDDFARILNSTEEDTSFQDDHLTSLTCLNYNSMRRIEIRTSLYQFKSSSYISPPLYSTSSFSQTKSLPTYQIEQPTKQLSCDESTSTITMLFNSLINNSLKWRLHNDHVAINSNKHRGNYLATEMEDKSQSGFFESSLMKHYLSYYMSFGKLKKLAISRFRSYYPKIVEVNAIRLIRLDVPLSIQAGQPLRLRCLFETKGEKLQSLSWYKNGREFYRYQPFERKQPVLAFKLNGVHVDLSRSRNSTVILTNTTSETSGRYKCEATGTTFQEVNMETYVNVLSAPPSASSITHPTPTSKYIYIFVIVITFLIDRSHRFDFQIE